MNVEYLNTIIRNRRSVFPKDYTGERIDDKIILQLLENANWAPTHKLTEPWRFKVFCDEGLIVFAEFQAQKYHDRCFGKEDYLEKKYHKLLNNPLKCSHIISIGMHYTNDTPIPETEEIAAVSCAVQNILLSAHAYGLGAYWTTGGVTYDDSSKSFFDLSNQDKLLGFIYLGVTSVEPTEGKRTNITDKVKWVRES
ncbi:MAG: nitroreductase [Bacteroidetes bacterium]|nr:MAG: nitroreductase [Bacteroidota bacterium]